MFSQGRGAPLVSVRWILVLSVLMCVSVAAIGVGSATAAGRKAAISARPSLASLLPVPAGDPQVEVTAPPGSTSTQTSDGQTVYMLPQGATGMQFQLPASTPQSGTTIPSTAIYPPQSGSSASRRDGLRPEAIRRVTAASKPHIRIARRRARCRAGFQVDARAIPQGCRSSA